MGIYIVLATNESRSSSAVYEIRRGHDGVVYCTCPAWRMKSGRASCRHLDEYLARTQPARAAGPASQITTGNMGVGAIVECRQREVVFLLKVEGFFNSGRTVRGIELLDPGKPQTSLRGERFVDVMDIVRVVVPRRAQ